MSRRDWVPFDPRYCEKLARSGRESEPDHVFGDIYRRHHWSGSESRSGAGASQDQTGELRRLLRSYVDIRRALEGVARSGIPYMLTTTFPDCEANEDIVTGDWRVLNLERAPFHLPAPVRILNERCTEGGGMFADKSLGLWRTADLRDLPFLNS